MLLFWETPLAYKFLSEPSIQVSLIEKIEEKETPQVLSPVLPPSKSKAAPKRKEVPSVSRPEKKEKKIEEKREEEKAEKEEKKAEREEKKTEREEKKAEREEKKEPLPKDLPEGKPKKAAESPSEKNHLLPPAPQPLEFLAQAQSSTQENGQTEPSKYSFEGGTDFWAPEGSGSTSGAAFVSSSAPRAAGEDLGLGAEGRNSVPAGGKSPPQHMAHVPSFPPEKDPILSTIIRKIEAAKRYPRVARKMGIEGTTIVRFKIKPDGRVEIAEVIESSGSEILDKASIATVHDAAPFPYKEGWLKVGIVFKIL